MGKAAKSKGQLLQGTLDLLILQSLARGVLHGYSLAEYIQHASEDVLRVEEGALYPALHRLELRGLLAAEWGVSEIREQPASQVLPADRCRAEGVDGRNRSVVAAVRSGVARPGSELSLGRSAT